MKDKPIILCTDVVKNLADEAGIVNNEKINSEPTICAVTLTVQATKIKK